MRLSEARPDETRVRLSRPEPGLAWIEMVDEAGDNGFSPPFVAALLAALEAVGQDAECKVAVLTGTPRVFSSGATAEVLRALKTRRLAPAELTLGRRLVELPVPVIAGAQGAAVGGGLALMLSADLVVVAEEARYGANFMSLGITPGMGTTRLLEAVLTPARAHELLYTGAFVRGAALAGGVNAVVPAGEVAGRALDIAHRVAEAPRENIVLLKRALTLPRRRALEEAMTLEPLMHQISLERLDPAALPAGGGDAP